MSFVRVRRPHCRALIPQRSPKLFIALLLALPTAFAPPVCAAVLSLTATTRAPTIASSGRRVVSNSRVAPPRCYPSHLRQSVHSSTSRQPSSRQRWKSSSFRLLCFSLSTAVTDQSAIQESPRCCFIV